MMDLYSDPLVTISDEGIRVRGYYMIGGDKRVAWRDIESVRALLPTLWNGRWRLSGTGTFRTWFASDFGRPARQTIFIMKLRTQWIRVGFTVHDAPRVKALLRERGVLLDEQGDALPKPMPVETRPMWRWGAFYALIALLGAFVAQTIYYYPRLPQRVATHFNFYGQADNFGSKAELTTVMIAAAGIAAGMMIAVSYAFSQSAAAPLGRFTLWFAAATVALVLVIAHFTFRANLTPTPSLGLAPLWALGAYFGSLAVITVLLLRKLAQ